VAEHLGLGPVCRNPFRSIHVRAVETYYALDEALRLIAEYTPPPQPAIDALPRAATGYGCSEAPRGLLYHRYQLDGDGIIRDARIIPPTSQNLRSIERDLRDYAGARLSLPNDELAWQCEQMIRNYDPCISCATHALRLHVVEE
jgi:coenzyme F420-reducing hydrogenase alpha subunit